MNKRSILASAAFLGISLLPLPALAQSNIQNNVNNNLQQQSSDTQATGNPIQTQPNDSIQKNTGSEALTQQQRSSLGVVSNPSQSSPSVSVGPSDTSNKSSTSKNEGSTGIVASIVVFAIILVGYGAWLNRKKPTNVVSEPVAAKIENVSAEQSVDKPAVKPKKSKKTQKKKQKKRLHR